MRKFDSVQSSDRLSLSPTREPVPDTPRFGDVMFEIGLILAVHLGIAVAVTLLLRDCTSC
jgi:hypothetical protein